MTDDTAAQAETPLARAVLRALASVIDPELRRPITDLHMIGGVSVDSAGAASIELKLTIVGCPAATSIESDRTACTLP